MPADRFFSEQALDKGSDVLLSGQEYHHLVHVMRGKVGDALEVVDGQGHLGQAHVASITKRGVLLSIDQVTAVPRPRREVILAQALPRAGHLDVIVEKGTELGMTHLWLFPGQLSDKRNIPETVLERSRGVAIAAMKQCGRLYLPAISIQPALKDWQKPEVHGFFGDLRPEAVPLSKALSSREASCLVVIGPESGFSDEEVTCLEALGIQGVKLHDNILRTETAAIVALAIVTTE